MENIAQNAGFKNIAKLHSDNFLLKFRNLWGSRKSSQKQYLDPDIILPNLKENEVFVDGGCLDFGSSIDFLNAAPSVRKIYAFEPSSANAKRIKEVAGKMGLSNVEIINGALWKSDTMLNFYQDESASYSNRVIEDLDVYKAKAVNVPAVALDNAVKDGDAVTFIKLDIEGAEMEALMGMKNTILRHKPKLAISLYHRPCDYVEIPAYIKSLVPEYKAYIRHENESNSETVFYCVI